MQESSGQDWRIEDGALMVGTSRSRTVLSGIPGGMTLVPDANEVGTFLQLTADKPASLLSLALGDLTGVKRFTSCHRYEPFWMTPKAGTRGGEIAKETQFLLGEYEDGSVLLLAPLISGAFRCCLEGTGEEGVLLIAESGDDAIVTDTVVGLFVACGEDPFALLKNAARSVADHLKTGRLREEKALPEFVDRFGWCTWDAFYQEVSQEKVREGLESFERGGVSPRLLILDDGWQSVKAFPTGEKRLTSFAANEKFGGDLTPTVAMAREEFGVEIFLVWHAVVGYWGGVDGDALPGYGVRSVARKYSPAIDHYAPLLRDWFGYACGTVDTTAIYRFYQDYHRHLRKQGVDGVKVDNQSSLEGLSHGGGYGGRVALMQAYHEALEGSVQTQFQGNLINCMSCANEMLYSLLNSTVTRTSTDFWPNRPESHGLHLYCNAQVSAWFGEFAHPDWDMFQSGHAAGAFHAAGRAVSGGPVYVSDKVGVHDFDLLKKLVLPDGCVLRCAYPGRPTRDCLFHDPTKEDILLKIWNCNPLDFPGQDAAGILGVFHARFGEGIGPIAGMVRPSDIEGMTGERFAVYSHYGKELRVMGREDAWAVTLEPLTAEVFTVVPIERGFAAVGLANLFNSAGAVMHASVYERGAVVGLVTGGTFIAYSALAPASVTSKLTETAPAFSYDPATGMLTVEVAVEDIDDPVMLEITFAPSI